MTAPPVTPRRVRGTNLAYASLAEWLDSRLPHRRADPLLIIVIITAAVGFIAALPLTMFAEAAIQPRSNAANSLFDQARRAGDIPSGHGLQREFNRSEIGTLLVETRNRLDALRNGRADRPRPKGPRFDPALSQIPRSSG